MKKKLKKLELLKETLHSLDPSGWKGVAGGRSEACTGAVGRLS
jgi:hypothetical protein